MESDKLINNNLQNFAVQLAKLEAKSCTKFESMEKALQLAKEQMDYRLAGMNEFQKRMDKLEGTFVTEKEVNTRFDSLSKIVYIGIGVVLALQFALRYL